MLKNFKLHAMRARIKKSGLSVCPLVRALNTLTYGLSCIMTYIFLVIFFSNNFTRLRLVQLLEKKMTRKIYVIMHSRPYVNAYRIR